MARIQQLDHVGITVADLDAATAFFTDIGLEIEGRTFLEGEFVDTVTGIPDARTEIVVLRPPGGGTGVELATFIRPAHEPGSPDAMGFRSICFQVVGLEEIVESLAARGFGLVGGVGRHEDTWLMAHVRGPEGLVVSLTEQIG